MASSSSLPSSNSTSNPNPQLLQALLLATSSSSSCLSQASQLFSNWETQPEFWLILLQVAFHRDLAAQLPQFIGQDGLGLHPTNTDQQALEIRAKSMRTVAIIRFKNGVDKFWRTRVVA